MRNKNWLRYGVASASIVGLVMGGILVACGDDDNGTTSGPDAGKDNNVPPTDSGNPTDSGTDANKGDAGQPAKLVMVHAGTDLGANVPQEAFAAIRVCFATAPKSAPNDFQVTPFPILPHSLSDGGATDSPGILVGTGGAFPSSGANYEDLVIRPYIMNAFRLNQRGIVGSAPTTPRCNQVLKDGFVPDAGWDGGEPLQANKDFWQLADIPAGTLKMNKTYILALTGCTADTDNTAFAGKCGNEDQTGAPYVPPGTPGVGNLKIMILEVDDASSVAGDEIGAQFIHLSPQWETPALARPGLNPGMTNDLTDAAAFHPATSAPDGGYRFARDGGAATTMVKIKGISTPSAYWVAHPAIPTTAMALNNIGGGGNPTVQYLTTGRPDAAELYVNGQTFTFVAVGDPDANAQGLRKFHYLGFPNKFTPPKLQ